MAATSRNSTKGVQTEDTPPSPEGFPTPPPPATGAAIADGNDYTNLRADDYLSLKVLGIRPKMFPVSSNS